MRNYNIDAYRQLRELLVKLPNSPNHNDMLCSIHDICINLLSDVLYTNPCRYPSVQDVTLENLIVALATRKHNLGNEFVDWKRLYHTYCLVYDSYVIAKAEDIIPSLNTLRAIIHWYVEEASMEHLIQTYNFVMPNVPLEEKQKFDDRLNRVYIANVLGLLDIPDPTF